MNMKLKAGKTKVFLAASLLMLGSGFAFVSIMPRDTGNAEFINIPDFVAVKPSPDISLFATPYEITVAQWQACVSSGMCEAVVRMTDRNRNHPITNVNWYDVKSYIYWLERVSNKKFRVPTYTEWMQLAGDQTPKPRKKLFDDPRMAWSADYDLTAEPIIRITQPAGNFGQNENSLYDIKGNVWEWTASECGTQETDFMPDCRAGRIAMGEHLAVLSEFVRDPGKAGCSVGQPPANIGFRLVLDTTG